MFVAEWGCAVVIFTGADPIIRWTKEERKKIVIHLDFCGACFLFVSFGCCACRSLIWRAIWKLGLYSLVFLLFISLFCLPLKTLAMLHPGLALSLSPAYSTDFYSSKTTLCKYNTVVLLCCKMLILAVIFTHLFET